MGTRLVPSYVEKPAWKVYAGYIEFLDTDDFDALREAVTELRDALLRAQAVRFAPDDVLEEWMNDPAR